MAGALELVDWPADKTLALSGSATGLKLPLSLRSAGPGVQSLAELSLAEVRLGGRGAPLRLQPVPVGLNLAGEGVTRARLRLRLDPATPPGRYQGKVKVGDLTRTVAIEVLAEARLAIQPAPVVLDAGAGASQQFNAAFENLGNVSLTLDLTGRYPLGEEIPIASDAADTVGSTGDQLASLLDRLSGRGSVPPLKSFGTAELGQPAGRQVLAPGETRVVAVELTLPTPLSPTARYHLMAPLYAADLHIVIVTAAKSAPPSPRRRTRGAAA